MHISLLGTGLLGSAVAERLLAAGLELWVWNRTADKTAPLVGRGARAAASAAEALGASAITLLFLADHAACEAVLFNPASRAALSGKIVVQMGTIGPDDSRALAEALAAAGAAYGACPVLGSLPEARAGRLILMYGGEEALFGQIEPILRLLGPDPRRIGEVGQAAALKLALNQLIAAETAAFALSLGLVQAYGVAVEDFMHILRGSALYAPTFDKKLDRMLSGHFANPNFPLDHLLKDVRLCLRAARQAGIDTSPLAALEAVLGKVSAQGHGSEDYSVLVEGLRPQ